MDDAEATVACFRVDAGNPDFLALVAELDAVLAARDGANTAFYGRFNKVDAIKHVIVAYADGAPIGCGALREYSRDAMEVKRMYVRPGNRGRGVASRVLASLETWAAELRYGACILETGTTHADAIALYLKNGYARIPNYGQYRNVERSACFGKALPARE